MYSNSLKDNLNILMISETKLNSTFLSNQFTIEGYAAPIRFGRNERGGGILLYIRKDIPTRLLKTSWHKVFEGLFIELNLPKKRKYLYAARTVLLRATYLLILVLSGDNWIAASLATITFDYWRP